jgi:hypothetical protein
MNTNVISLVSSYLKKDHSQHDKASKLLIDLWLSCDEEQRILIDNVFKKMCDHTLTDIIKETSPQHYKQVIKAQHNEACNKKYAISITWNIENVLEVRPSLTAQQAINVLHELKYNHYTGMDINWTTVTSACDRLYPIASLHN